MEVWVCEWKYPSDNECNISIFDSEQAALKQAADEIVDHIDNHWDSNDEQKQEYGDQIHIYLSQKHYKKVIRHFNDYQDNYESDYTQYWTVYSRKVKNENGDEVNPQTADCNTALAFKASTPGATCRGPCKNYNEFAYADQQDGTHICFQCKTFKGIFGT
jgi:hypothetical protein